MYSFLLFISLLSSYSSILIPLNEITIDKCPAECFTGTAFKLKDRKAKQSYLKLLKAEITSK